MSYPGAFCDVDLADRALNSGVCIRADINTHPTDTDLCREGKFKHPECVIASIRSGDIFKINREGEDITLCVVDEAGLRDALALILKTPCRKEHITNRRDDWKSFTMWITCGETELIRTTFPDNVNRENLHWWQHFALEQHKADCLPDAIIDVLFKSSIERVT